MRSGPERAARQGAEPHSVRVSRGRSEVGDTLVEILLAIVVISLGALAILTAFATSITGTGTHRNFTTLDTMVRTASSVVSSSIQQQPASDFANCSGAYQYSAPGSIPLSGSYSAWVQYVAYWNGNGFTNPTAPAQSCPHGALPNSPQQLTVTVSYKGASSSITTVVNDPNAPPPATCQYPASQLVWLQQPSTTPAGAALFPVPEVAVEDKTGCIVSNDASRVALAITPGTGAVGATLNNCAANANGGTTVFLGCSIGVPGTGYTLTASDPTDGLTAVQSGAFSVTSGIPAILVFKQQPGGGTGGTPWSTGHQPVVWIEDSQGNVVTTDQSTVSLSIGTNPNGGTLSGCAAANAVNGVATFSGCTIDKAGSGYTLTATDAADSMNVPVVSSTFDITAGPPSKLAFITSPAGAVASDPFSTQPAVQIEDAGGNLVTTATSSVSLALGTNPSHGTLSGCSATTVSGVATFTGCAVSQVGTGYTVVAADGLLAPDTSGPFDVVAQQLTSFAVNPTTSTPTAGTAFDVTVTALDQAGGTFTGLSGSQALSFSGPASAPNGDTPVYPGSVAFSAGVGTASITLVDAESPTLTVTLGPLAGTSASFTVTAGAQASLSLTNITQPPTPAVTCSGPSAGLTTCLSSGEGTLSGNGNQSKRTLTAKLQLLDAYGNTVTNSGSTVSISLSHTGSVQSFSPSLLSVATGSSTTSGSFTLVRSAGTNSATATAKVGTKTELTVTLSS